MTDLTIGPGKTRIASVDLLRGLVMVIMALDHVRDFWSITPFDPTDLTQTDTGYFFTRWITHFCAPIFVFLSGVSAFLYQGNKQVTTRELSLFLLSRGVWLVFLEITLISFFWQFGYQFILVQVIWAIGWSMIALALLVYLPKSFILVIGLGMIFSHNALDGIAPAEFGDSGWLWSIVHVQGFIPFQLFEGFQGVFLAYPLVPWIGVIAVGYCFGPVLQKPEAERNRWLYAMGLGALAAFLLLRGFNIYGDSGIGPGADAPWIDHGKGSWVAFMSFINTTKYPPSLLFLLMTIGPALALIPLLERWRGKAADFFTTFGRVPFLFYVVHIPLIHATSLVWTKIDYDVLGLDPFNPVTWPVEYEPNLLRAYLVWVAVIVVLYWPCKWFVAYRKTHTQWWLSYV
jgi:uncharacterized membrane protein